MQSRSRFVRRAAIIKRIALRKGVNLVTAYGVWMLAALDWPARKRRAMETSPVMRAFAAVLRAFAIGKLSPRQQKVVAATGAIGAQLVLALMLVIGSHVVLARPPDAAEVTISGPWGSPEARPAPAAIQPELPTITPPEIQISDAVDQSAADTPGLPNVSRPAEAIAAAHLFPPTPAAYRSGGAHSVTLLLSVSEGGAVSAAAVQTSSGVAALDGMALDWVKQHWRYLPALRNGVPVSVTTTAIVTFLNT